jgi:hypothetical protein
VALQTALLTLRELLEAMDQCLGHRGWLSCVEEHDPRCPKGRASRPEDWRGKGDWQCLCGYERLLAAREDAQKVMVLEALRRRRAREGGPPNVEHD